MDPSTSLGSLLSGIFSGAYGLNQLMGSGGSSAAGSAAAGAAAASPFQSQFGNYQPQIPGQISTIQGQQGNVSGNATDVAKWIEQMSANTGSTISGLMGGLGGVIGGAQGLNPNVAQQAAALPTSVQNMTDPSTMFRYQTGLDALNRSQAATGQINSGASMLEAEKYGQEFATENYQTSLQNLLTTQGQQFSQGLQQQSLLGTLFGEQGNLALGGASSQLQAGGLTGSVLGNEGSTLLNSSQGLLNSLMGLSGATTGSPATAGSILSGQFTNSNTAAGNLFSGITGATSGLNGLTGGSLGNGVSSLLNGLFGGGGGGDLGSLLGGLGSSGIGSIFSGGGAADTVFGNSITDLGGLVGDTAGGTGILGDVGSLLGGLF